MGRRDASPRQLGGLLAAGLLLAAGAAPAAALPLPWTGVVAQDGGVPARLQATAVATRVPEPTPTPGVVTRAFTALGAAAGLDQLSVLGLSVVSWVDLGVSLLLVLLGLLVGVRLVNRLLRRLARATPSAVDDALLALLRTQVTWLVGVLLVQLAVDRLAFVPAGVKAWLDVQGATVTILILAVAAWRLIRFGVQRARQAGRPDTPAQTREAFLGLLERTAQLLVVVTTAALLFSNYGYSVTIPVALLALLAFVASIAARDTLSDVVDGVLILLDRPFRVGDRIEIQELDAWGDVVAIGTRSTRIRTRDNRVAIVPNSKIGRSLVVNYSYPDARYRVELVLDVAYGTDLARLGRLATETIRRAEGVLAERPVDVLLDAFGDSALRVRVRWWIHSYADTSHLMDGVHRALYRALQEHGIHLPFPTYQVRLESAGAPAAVALDPARAAGPAPGRPPPAGQGTPGAPQEGPHDTPI
jgi:small-conductance mechanosensitive channel